MEFEDYFGSSRILVKLTKRALLTLIGDRDFYQAIKWFDSCPTPQRNISEILEGFSFATIGEIKPPAADAPLICIIDSGVTAGNPFIRPLIKTTAPPLSYISSNANTNDEGNHGTGVAALAAYHSLKIDAGDTNNPVCWIASAKVLNQHNKLEEEKLFSKTLRQIVSDHKKLGVRIFNLSMVFEKRIWNREYIESRKIKKKSWIARTIDNISRDEDVLFIICTGNIDLPVLNNFIGTHEHYPEYFRNGEYSLQDPANSTYAITVGSIIGTTVIAGGEDLVALGEDNHPSPFTRHGPGILNSIKPEVVEVGGGLAFNRGMGRAVRHSNFNIVTASNQVTPALHQGTGTSYAAPRATYKAAKILAELALEGITNPSINLLKSFIINSAESITFSTGIDRIIRDNSIKKENLVGYGQINSDLALFNDPTNILMYLEEKIPLDNILIVSIPVPPEVSQFVGRKKLKVTVSFSPELQKSGLKKYHGSKFSWDIFRGDNSDEEIIELLSAEGGEIDDEDAPKALTNYKYGKRLRSKSCIQHDEFEWDRHPEDYSSHDYKLAISTQNVWKTNQADIPVSVVVHFSTQNSTNIEINLHSIIETMIQVPIQNRIET